MASGGRRFCLVAGAGKEIRLGVCMQDTSPKTSTSRAWEGKGERINSKSPTGRKVHIESTRLSAGMRGK